MDVRFPMPTGAAALGLLALAGMVWGAATPAAAQVLTGRVVLAGWHENVPAARVQLLDQDLVVVSEVASDSAGRFRFTGVGPGVYHLQAVFQWRSSAVAGPVRFASQGARADTLGDVELTLPSELYRRARACLPDGPAQRVRPTGAGVAPAPGVLAGVAYDEGTATPLPGARVTLEWADSAGQERRLDTRTDPAGRFVFCDVVTRIPLTVRLDVLGGASATYDMIHVQPGALARMDLSAQLPAARQVRVVREEPLANPDSLATLQGRLLDASTDAPIANADVALESTALATVTDDEGRFRISGVPAGRHAFQVQRLGYDWRSEYLSVEPGATVVLELRAAPRAVDLEAVVVRVTTPEMRMARAMSQAPRVVAGIRLYRAEQRAASLVDVIRSFPSLQIRPGQFETEQGVERGLCIESSRALMRFAIPEKKTPLPWCEMIAIVIDGITTIRGTEMIKLMRLRQVESIEFLPPTGALRYGERAALNGALVIWTRGRGPHRDPGRSGG